MKPFETPAEYPHIGRATDPRSKLFLRMANNGFNHYQFVRGPVEITPEHLAKATVVVATDAFNFFRSAHLDSEQMFADPLDFYKDAHCIRPPVSPLWIEADDNEGGIGMLMIDFPPNEREPEAGGGIFAITAHSWPNVKPMLGVCAAILKYDAEGKLKIKESQFLSAPLAASMGEWEYQGYQATVMANTGIFLATVSLMNQKNAKLAERDMGHEDSKRCNRQYGTVKQQYRYSTILIDGRPLQSRRLANGTGPAGMLPFHLVRGHHKTYRAEAPRFGRDVGTFWVDAFTRGDKKNGERGHAYKVLPTTE